MKMRSPGSSSMVCDSRLTSSATEKISCSVELSCTRVSVPSAPMIVVEIASCSGSANSSSETIAGPGRREALERLAHAELRGLTLPLHGALREVLADGVAGDAVRGLGERDVATAAADHDDELGLPVDGVAGEAHVDVGSGDGGCELGEDDGLLRDRQSRLLRVVGVVQADADHLPRTRRRRAERRRRRRRRMPGARRRRPTPPSPRIRPSGRTREPDRTRTVRRSPVRRRGRGRPRRGRGDRRDWRCARGGSFLSGVSVRVRTESADRGFESVVRIGRRSARSTRCADPGGRARRRHPTTGAKPWAAGIDVRRAERHGGPRHPATTRGRRRAR